jgi:hypothetical protein
MALSILLLIGFTACAHSYTSIWHSDPDGISGFDFYDSSSTGNEPHFVWWKRSKSGHDCDSGVPDSVGRIRRAGFLPDWHSSDVSLVEESCGLLSSKFSNVATDGYRNFYYFDSGGQLVTKSFNETSNTPATPLLTAPPLPSQDPGSYVEYYDNTLFWARYENSYSHLYSMPEDGSQSPTQLESVQGMIKKIKGFAFSDGEGGTVKAIAYLTDEGLLRRRLIDPPGTIVLLPKGMPPITNCNDFDVYTHSDPNHGPLTWIYAATGEDGAEMSLNIQPGKLHRIDAKTGFKLNSVSATDQFQIISVAVFRKGEIFTGQLGDLYCTGGYDLCSPTRIKIVRRQYDLSSLDPFMKKDGGRNLKGPDVGLFFLKNNQIIQLIELITKTTN